MSRDDMAAALLEVVAGRIPLDRIALRELSREVKDWPYLDAEEQLAQEDQQADASYESITDTGTRSMLVLHYMFGDQEENDFRSLYSRVPDVVLLG